MNDLRRIGFTDMKCMPRVLSETKEGYLSLDPMALNRQTARRVSNLLAYFSEKGKLPDPELAKKIRNHPRVTTGPDWEDIKAGKRHVLICHHCQELHAWKYEACDKCGHGFQDPEDVYPGVLEVILSDLDRLHEEDLRQKEMNCRYPLPEERQDKTYLCQGCGRTFKDETSSCDARARMACSAECFFRVFGRPMPEGRKFLGFLTPYPDSKGKSVFYLGAAKLRRGYRKEVLHEFYEGPFGQTYAYSGNGKGEYFCWMTGAYANRSEQKVIEATGVRIDESWRILANIKESYQWKS